MIVPGNIFAADTSFPQFYGEQSANEKIDVITDYLFMLLEELRYTLANLGQENFNDTELGNIAKIITDPVYLRLESITGEVASISATAEGLETSFYDLKGNVSTLTQTAENLSIKMGNLEGDVTLLQTTASGLSLQVRGHDASIASLDATIGSIGLSVTNGEDSSSLTLSVVKDGVTLSSTVGITLTGMVTFASLSGSGTSVINGDNIKTGTISAITIDSCVMKVKANASGWNYGGYYMYYTDAYGEYLAGSLMLDVLNGVPRVYLRSTVSGGKVSYLQLYSETYLNISAESYVMIGDPNKLVPIYLYGQLYINGTQIG